MEQDELSEILKRCVVPKNLPTFRDEEWEMISRIFAYVV